MARLEFAGARYVRNYHLAVPHHELEIDRKKSLPSRVREGQGEGVGLDDNLIIHGDNLKALKSLLPHFAGKIKCIYIDPPYNTGNEKWVYNDNVNSPRHKEWLNKVVDKDCQDRHDRWLSMMMPRLKLLRELMRDDGVIFISIDDNEQHHLRMLMDEIFGSRNFLANILWQKRYSASNDATGIASLHDFILCYSKSDAFDRRLLPRQEKQDKMYKYDDQDGRGPWRSDNLTAKTFSEQYVFPIVNPNTGVKYMPPKGGCWRASKDTITRWLAENRIYFGKNNDGAPQLKRYLAEVQQGVVPNTWWTFEEAGHNDESKKEIIEIFGTVSSFETPKPTRLIERILQISMAPDDGSIVLDSFAGSGTTAHAVLALNKEDGGSRKFILVEQEDYADTITAERVRRVIKGYGSKKDTPSPNPSRKREGNNAEGLGGSFTYVTLGQEISENGMLSGKALPSYETLAEYCFFTATGKPFDAKKLDKKNRYIGSTDEYDVYLFYEPDVAKLKSNDTALTFNWVELQPKRDTKKGQKTKLVFAPVRYVGQEALTEYDIEFCQLPWEIYRKLEGT